MKITPDLNTYDWIVCSTSGGKDSIVALTEMWLALDPGQRHSLVAVHADLGALEHDGTTELVRRQCKDLGVELFIVEYVNKAGVTEDLLQHVERIGRTPGKGTQFCTSDHKRGPIRRVYTELAKLSRQAGHQGPVRILDVQGIRRSESVQRSKYQAFTKMTQNSNGRKFIDTWYPIFTWSTLAVWDYIKEQGLETLDTYKRLPRHSCQFCFYAPIWAQVQEAQLNPELAARYAAVEAKIGKTFHISKTPMSEIIQMAADDVRLPHTVAHCDWCQA